MSSTQVRLRELKAQLNLCHQQAASLYKQQRPGQRESNNQAMQRIILEINKLREE